MPRCPRSRLDELVAPRLHAALVNEGLRRRGRAWWAGDPSSGWTLFALSRWTYNDRDRAQFSVEAVIWPSGTWPMYAELLPDASSEALPLVDESAPLSAGPRELMPERYGRRDWPWSIQVRANEALAEVVDYCVQHALSAARRQLDVDVALASLTEQPRRWGPPTRVRALIYACGMLRAIAPRHPDRPATVTALRDEWLPDPRPPQLLPILQRWCEEIGVPLAAP